MNLNLKYLLIDLGAVLVIYFLPEISGLLNISLYLFEPMRIIIVLSIVHSSKNNSYLLALSLPLVSYLLSNHPSVGKTFILSGDLLLNIFLYFRLNKTYDNKFLCMVISIAISKIAYYLFKYLLMELSFIEGNLIATPIYIQLLIIVVLSSYVYLTDKLSPLKQISGSTK
jgi:hypothetical protein